MHQSGFGSAGRAEQEKVLAADQTNSEQVDDFVLADKIPFHRFENIRRKAGSDFSGGHGTRNKDALDGLNKLNRLNGDRCILLPEQLVRNLWRELAMNSKISAQQIINSRIAQAARVSSCNN